MMTGEVDHDGLATECGEFVGREGAVFDVRPQPPSQRHTEFGQSARHRSQNDPETGVPLAHVVEQRRPDEIAPLGDQELHAFRGPQRVPLVGNRLCIEKSRFVGGPEPGVDADPLELFQRAGGRDLEETPGEMPP